MLGPGYAIVAPKTLHSRRMERWALSPALRDAGAKTVLVDPDRAAVVPLEVVASKLRIPAPSRGAVSRTGLVNRLRAARSFPVATVVAPAGYGKTTALAQWADRDERPLAWITVDERDNDPFVFLRHVAAALGELGRIDAALLRDLRSPGDSVWDAVVPGVLALVSSPERTRILVVDDVHLLAPGEAASTLALLAENVPEGSTIVLAGRGVPAEVPLAALRAGGRLFELGPDDLALGGREARALARNAAVHLSDVELRRLLERTEGWAAGVHLEVLSEDVAGYFRSRCLAGLTPKRLAFLRRSSVLETMSGPACDAVLSQGGSASELEELERLNLFVTRVQGDAYRLHPLFRDLLRQELAEHECELVPVLHLRAADWYDARGEAESEIAHAVAAGDVDRVARVAASAALPLYCRGRAATVENWLEAVERHLMVAAQGARVHAHRGRPLEARRWLAAAGDDAIAALVHAELCADGIGSMAADSARALKALPEGSLFRAPALLAHGVALFLAGDHERADLVLSVAADLAERFGLAETQLLATAERFLVTGNEEHALATAGGLQEHGLDGYPTISLPLAVCARLFLRRGRSDQARGHLDRAQELLPGLTYALPWLAVQARLELTRALIALRDAGPAHELLKEVGTILRFRPELGPLPAQATALRRELRAIPAREGRATLRLTTAELRLLPLLATHLSFREIGQRLFVSRNTIKTQAISVYRKLGVSRRSDAIDRAVELGLLDAGSPDVAALG
jgi:LuxR family transcriptional regulator, maltose regulon positive regulatory protein